MGDAKAKFRADIEKIEAALERLGVPRKQTILCITGKDNFRKEVLPTYKGHRKRKPPGYSQFQEWVLEESGYTVFLRPRLEADDCLGILGTGPTIKGPKVIWSEDKDLRQIPGTHLDMKNRQLVEVSELDGELLHVKQTLTGDVTDGYTGLKGFGPVSVNKLIDKHAKDGLPALWAAVQEQFEKKGMTREDMLVQARVARILRASDYNFKNKDVILWQPR
ncbi:hypothetical protein [Komagataeibacter sp. FNDCR2]|uniref:hypothetical protein n=1 Tax=Komagataeibacter sp. FNDCR2 TaxID=2878682 RepID=UPI001E3DA344|nr:hypothetical protein [Komagataeibacter sp. FNDCR2]MCE2576892.1 hypothetical protein [Komagataeibacter sp. FNDCR2]